MRTDKFKYSFWPAFFLTFAVFFNSLFNGFVWDDNFIMRLCEQYKSFDIQGILFKKANPYEYLPVRDISIMLDYAIWGDKPFGFHLSNLMVYSASLFFLFRSLVKLTSIFLIKNSTFFVFVVLIFYSVNPIQTETVNFIYGGRNTLLASFFVFLSLDFYLKSITEKKNLHFAFSAFFFILALFSKATAIFLPIFLLLLFLILPNNTFSKKRNAAFIFIMFVIDFVVVFIHLMDAVSRRGSGVLAIGEVFAKVSQIPHFYLKKIIFPLALNVQYKIDFLFEGHLVYSFLLLISSLAVSFFFFRVRKSYPFFLIGLIWFFSSLLPVLNIVPTSPVVAERYAHFPLLGLCIIMASFLDFLKNKKKSVLPFVFIVVLLWVVTDFQRNKDWISDLSLWTASVKSNPNVSRVNLAVALFGEGRYEESLEQFKLEYEKSGDVRYFEYLGRYSMKLGRLDSAIKQLKRGILESSEEFDIFPLLLAKAYEEDNQAMLAVSYYNKFIATKDEMLLIQFRQIAEDGLIRNIEILSPKLNMLRQKVADDPESIEAVSRLAFFLHQIGNIIEAKEYYRRALILNDGAWQAYYNLGLILKAEGKIIEAIDYFKKTSIILPEYAETYSQMGNCYSKLGDYVEAAKQYEKALSLKPDSFKAAFNTGRMYSLVDEDNKAKHYILKAYALARDNHGFQSALKNTYMQYFK